jgi:hypothetical protein
MQHKHPKPKRGSARAAKTTDSLPIFRRLFAARFDAHKLNQIWRTHQRRRRRPLLPFADLLLALVYHVLLGAGSLQDHVEELTGVRLSGSAFAQRRHRLHWKIFQEILALVLERRADPQQHPQAFYQGLRLLGVDGSRLAMTNTAQILRGFHKAVSRRMKAAFAQVQVAVLIELGLHNPVAVEIGRKGESEMALGLRLLQRLTGGDLLLADRLYGVQKIVAQLLALLRQRGAHFLVRVRANLKARVLQTLPDGSALVEIETRDAAGRKQKLTLREIRGAVRGRNGKRTPVRLWTSLLDAPKYPAAELLGLYAQRWEVEITIQELKVEMRGRRHDLLAAQTPETAAQEIAALLLALAVLVQVRCEAARRGEVAVLRVSFRQTLRLVRALWTLLEIGEGIHTEKQVRALVARTLDRIAAAVTPERRARSCPRAVRQPVGSWPRLLRRQEWQGAIQYEILPVTQ